MPATPPNQRTTRRSTDAHAGARWKVPVAAAFFAVALLGAAIVLSRGTTKSSATETHAVAVSGAALAPLPDPPATDPAVGSIAPALTSASFDGAAASIRPGSTPMVVMFVAHWCPHCRREVPAIVGWLHQFHAPAGVELHAVATATQSNLPNYPPSSWLAKEEWPVPTIVDDAKGSAAAAFGVTAFPYFAVLDRTGKVVMRVTGELTKAQFLSLLDDAHR